VATVEGFLRHFDAIRVVPVDADVAREGARVRAATSLPMPDALIVASAIAVDADSLVTVDRTWRRRLVGVMPNFGVIELGSRNQAP
jgi:predicted nucleic acid-binding protein